MSQDRIRNIKLYTALRKLGLSQGDIARESGITQQTVSWLILMGNEPRPDTYRKLKNTLKRYGMDEGEIYEMFYSA